MVEPLSIDPARLLEAGSQLRALVFPQPPAPLAVPGSDAVSAAINATMPNIESLVTDGLPGVKAALTRTATSMGEAADVYQKADQSLGDALSKYQFSAEDMLSGSAATRLAQASGASSDTLPPQLQPLESKVAELQPRFQATVPQLVALAPHAGQAAQLASPMMSTLTSVAGQAGSGAGAGGSSAQLVSDTKPDDESSGNDLDEGAAAGSHARGSAPTKTPTAASGGTTGTTV